ncbi:MAG: acetyltransferase, partial [Leptospiraceae bacterium]|nr:acetyltransferase [Leptospiraceae bacterium]
MKPELVLIGAGGHARAVTDVIELEDRFRILGFLDTKLPPDTLVLGYPVLGGDDLIAEY